MAEGNAPWVETADTENIGALSPERGPAEEMVATLTNTPHLTASDLCMMTRLSASRDLWAPQIGEEGVR